MEAHAGCLATQSPENAAILGARADLRAQAIAAKGQITQFLYQRANLRSRKTEHLFLGYLADTRVLQMPGQDINFERTRSMIMRTIVCSALGALALVFMLSADSAAQQSPRRGSINSRQQNQRQRIRQGVRSGELTARETGRLVAEQVHINRMEDRFRTSGDGLSNRERVRLQRELNQSSRHIRRQKHDEQDRQPPVRP